MERLIPGHLLNIEISDAVKKLFDVSPITISPEVQRAADRQLAEAREREYRRFMDTPLSYYRPDFGIKYEFKREPVKHEDLINKVQALDAVEDKDTLETVKKKADQVLDKHKNETRDLLRSACKLYARKPNTRRIVVATVRGNNAPEMHEGLYTPNPEDDDDYKVYVPDLTSERYLTLDDMIKRLEAQGYIACFLLID